MARKQSIQAQLDEMSRRYNAELCHQQALTLLTRAVGLPPGFRFVKSPRGYFSALTHVEAATGNFTHWIDDKGEAEWRALEAELFRAYGDDERDRSTLSVAMDERRAFHAKLREAGSVPLPLETGAAS